MTKHIDETAWAAAIRHGQTNKQIAAALGVTERTLTRRRVANRQLAARLDSARAEWIARQEHGTPRTYKRGCRCDLCRAANKQRVLAWRAESYAKAIPPNAHGRASTYSNWGCRCAECTRAHSARCAEYARRRAAEARQGGAA